MFRNNKSYAILLMVSLLMVLAVPCTTGCGESAAEDTAVTEETEESMPPAGDDGTFSGTPPDGAQVPMMNIDMEELGRILGIEPEKVEAAFRQAMEETFSAAGTFPGEDVPDRQPPEDFNREPPGFDGERPEGMLEDERPEGRSGRQPGIPEEVLTRVAEILNIGLQELEDAISQLESQAP
jgi:hypothetical protein